MDEVEVSRVASDEKVDKKNELKKERGNRGEMPNHTKTSNSDSDNTGT